MCNLNFLSFTEINLLVKKKNVLKPCSMGHLERKKSQNKHTGSNFLVSKEIYVLASNCQCSMIKPGGWGGVGGGGGGVALWASALREGGGALI